MRHSEHPVRLEIERPERFDRAHVIIRAAILIAFSLLMAFLWLLVLIYVAVPFIAAILISSERHRFREEGALRIKRWIHTIVAADAYYTLLTDRFSLERPEDNVRLEFEVSANPTPGSALSRLVTSVPSALVLLVLGIAAIVSGIVAGLIALVAGNYPEPIYRFHYGVVNWTARLLAYHASLVDEYPPFSLRTDGGTHGQVSPPAHEPV